MRLATSCEAQTHSPAPLLHGTRSLSGHAVTHRLPMARRSLDRPRPTLGQPFPPMQIMSCGRQCFVNNPQTPGLCLDSKFRPHQLGDSPPEPRGQVSVFNQAQRLKSCDTLVSLVASWCPTSMSSTSVLHVLAQAPSPKVSISPKVPTP